MDDDPLLGRTLAGRYRLIARLGSGGMSAVYLARHVLIDRLSAIKILHDDRVPESVRPGEDARVLCEQFLREARAVNRINHPNIVEITDYGEATLTLDHGRRSLAYLVMEYVPGESLQKVLARGPLPLARVVPIAAQVGSALARAHQTGVIHRDVKPENILLVQRRDGADVVKLTDFGVAKITGTARATPAADQVFGTPGYVAPEYLLGETAIDGRADLYSLGVVLYQAITGALPFDCANEADLLTRPLTDDPIPPSARLRGLHPAIEALVLSLLRRRADERPTDAFAFLDALQRAATEAGLHGYDVDATPRIDEPRVVPRAADLRASGAEAVEEEPPPSRYAPSIPDPPRLGVVTPGALVAAWREHWDALAEHASARETPESIDDAIHRARLLVEGLDRAVTIVAETQRALDALEAEARDFRGTIGNAVDHLARDLSRAHARVVELTSQRAQLHLQRRNALDPAAADALLWEVAAVDAELRRAKAIREDLGHQIGTLQDELFRRNTLHEERVQRTSAALEGEAAAIATMHRELELLSGELARWLGVTTGAGR